jgi:hypothetical protein
VPQLLDRLWHRVKKVVVDFEDLLISAQAELRSGGEGRGHSEGGWPRVNSRIDLIPWGITSPK